MADVRIRDFKQSDYKSLVLIHDSLFSNNPLFLVRVKYEDSCYGRTRYRAKRFVAKEGDLYVGSSSLLESGVAGVIDQGFTVVRPDYRGRGIAQAVKVHTAMYAKSRGMRFIRTFNDSDNSPMLAVNRKIGFVKKAEWITFEKGLGAAP
jgi:GNAT superfamily N-acetyltransferase